MRKLLTAMLAVLVATSISARAAEQALRCKYLDGNNPAMTSYDMNQIVVDAEAKTIEFRVAETIGTSKPVRLRFDNKGTNRTILVEGKDRIVVGGLRRGAPFAIRIDKRTDVATLMYLVADLPSYARYKCSE